MYFPVHPRPEIILKQLRLSKLIVYNNHAIFCEVLVFHSRVDEVAILLGYVAALLDK
jgi:hypothetical protein